MTALRHDGTHTAVGLAWLAAAALLFAWQVAWNRRRRRASESLLPPLPRRVNKRPAPRRVPGRPVDGEPLDVDELYRLEEIDGDPDNEIPALAYDTGEAS
jgi:hypothetical protein